MGKIKNEGRGGKIRQLADRVNLLGRWQAWNTMKHTPLNLAEWCEPNDAKDAPIGEQLVELCSNIKMRLGTNQFPADRSTTSDHDLLYTIGSALAVRV